MADASRLRWHENPKASGHGPRGRFAPILEVLAHEQSLHPGAWAEIANYNSPDTAKYTASKLRKRFPQFQFRSHKDPDSGVGKVYARFVGEYGE